MTWLKNITICICAFSLLHTVIKMLAPNKYYPQMKTVISLLSVIMIGSMFIKFDISEISQEFESINQPQYLSQESRLVIKEIETRLSEYLMNALERRGIGVKKVQIVTNIDEEYCISISEAWIIVSSSDEAKKETIKKIVNEEIGDIDVIIEVSEE